MFGGRKRILFHTSGPDNGTGGLFQYLYFIKYGQPYREQDTKEISEEEFESLMMKFLPVTAEQLKQYAVYDPEKRTYGWAALGCGNYSPNAFETFNFGK